MDTQQHQQLAQLFYELHQEDSAFVIPNPWDVGTTRLLSGMGYKALATTSAGCAFFNGQQDNTLGREAILANAQVIVDVTALPVSADLENGFGDSPEAVVDTIKGALDIGLAGGSIEDANNLSDSPIYSIELAAEKVRAAAETIAASDIPFVLTARAENYLFGNNDIKDTIARLQAYQAAGADVLYAPGVTSKEDIAAIVSSVDKPVNVVMGLAGGNLSVRELSELGVKRISVGSALARAALGEFIRAASEMQEEGTFSFADEAIGYGDISQMLS
ncbi:2-methylisocitrate lyase [Gammaproteobacteria bacterium 45_16_T64]|nr:2-methylisocitrate lyase [Gammaproteobacteria bacterium 45_16_T64]